LTGIAADACCSSPFRQAGSITQWKNTTKTTVGTVDARKLMQIGRAGMDSVIVIEPEADHQVCDDHCKLVNWSGTLI
jgi:hypothetical protein